MSRDYINQKAAHAKGSKPQTAGGGAEKAARKPAQDAQVSMVVGLGNPGKEYDYTRHNVGFAAVDALAAELGATYWKTRPGALVAETSRGGRKVVLVKPQSYMNVSGGPVAHLAKEYGVAPEGILVAHDDLEVPPGQIRVRLGGGHAGHNGLRSICDKLGTHDFARLRVGIGRPPGRMAPADFVLKQMRGNDAQEFDLMAANAAHVALEAIDKGLAPACEHYA